MWSAVNTETEEAILISMATCYSTRQEPCLTTDMDHCMTKFLAYRNDSSLTGYI